MLSKPSLSSSFSSSVVVLLSALLMFSCSDSKETPPPKTTEKIGAAGGEFQTSEGAKIKIPAGALAEDTEIAIAPVTTASLTAGAPKDSELVSKPFAFTPHGTTFAKPVSIELPYTGEATGVVRLDNEQDTTWEEVPGATFVGGVASFQTDHFSIIAVIVTVYTPPKKGECVEPAEGAKGTATAEGSVFEQSFTPVSAYATLHQQVVTSGLQNAGKYATTFNIRIAEYDNACGYELKGLDLAGSRYFQLSIHEESDTAMPGLPPAKKYDFFPPGEDGYTFFPKDSPQFIGGTPVMEAAGSTTCKWSAWMGPKEKGGSITLDSVSEEKVTGSYVFNDGYGGTLSGTFDVPVCISEVTPEERCCVGYKEPPPPEDAVTGTIGAAGGTLSTPGGVTLTVPPDALTMDEEIIIESLSAGAITASLPANTILSGLAYTFTFQSGLTAFQVPVSISLPYAGNANTVLTLADRSSSLWQVFGEASFAAGAATFQTTHLAIFAPANDTTPPAQCDPPSAGAPTGSGTCDGTFGGMGLTPADAYAVLVQVVGQAMDMEEPRAYHTEFVIRITDYPGACGYELNGWDVKGGAYFNLRFVEESNAAQPGLPAVGTYPLSNTWPVPIDTAVFSGGGLISIIGNPGSCNLSSGMFGGQATGQVEITSITADRVKGNYTYNDGMGSVMSGTFDAPICTTLNTDRCCWETAP